MKSGSEVIKPFYAHFNFQPLIRTKKTEKYRFFLAFKPSDIVFTMLAIVKMPTIVGIFNLYEHVLFMLSSVENEKTYLRARMYAKIYPSIQFLCHRSLEGAQWLSGRVLDSRPKGRGFEPHRRHCVVVLEQDTFILA